MGKNWSELFKKQTYSLDQTLVVKCEHGFAPDGCYHCLKKNPPVDLNEEDSSPFTGLSELRLGNGFNKTEKL